MKKLAILATVALLSVQTFATKIGTVNTQELLFKYSKTKTLDAKLGKEKASLEKTLAQKEKEIQDLGKKVQAKGSKATDKEKAALKAKVEDAQKFLKASRDKLNNQKNQELKKIEGIMNSAIKKVATAEKVDYMLESAAVKLGGTDYTAKVLAEMEKTK